MLINLSNHPKVKWDGRQLAEALARFGAIEDLPFPAVPPNASVDEVAALALKYVAKCEQLLAGAPAGSSHAIHVMGEFTFTYRFVEEMEKRGIRCVAATTERLVTEDPKDPAVRTTVFRFVQFRPYFNVSAEPSSDREFRNR